MTDMVYGDVILPVRAAKFVLRE